MESPDLGIARDESLTRGLGDTESRMLVEALVLAVGSEPWRLEELRQRGKLASRMALMWSRQEFAGVAQLAACSGIEMVLPSGDVSNESFMERLIIACLK